MTVQGFRLLGVLEEPQVGLSRSRTRSPLPSWGSSSAPVSEPCMQPVLRVGLPVANGGQGAVRPESLALDIGERGIS